MDIELLPVVVRRQDEPVSPEFMFPQIRGLTREALWVFAAQVVTAVIGLVAVRALTGLFSPAAYGAWTLVLAGVALVTGIGFGPLNNAGIRFYHESREAGNSTAMIVTLLISCIGTYGVVLLVALLVSVGFGLLSAGRYPWFVLVWLGTMILLGDILRLAVTTLLNVSRRRKLYAVIVASDAVARPLAAIAFLLFVGATAEEALLGYGLAGLLAGVVSLWIWLRIERIGWQDREAFSWSLSREMLAYGWPFLGTSIASWVLAVSDRFLLGVFRSNAEVGLYTAGYQVGGAVPQFLGGIVAMFVAPLLLQNYASDPRSARDLGAFLGRFVVLSIPFVGGVVLYPNVFLHFLVARTYWGTGAIVSFVAAGTFLSSLVPLVANAFVLGKKSHALLAVFLLSASLNVVLNLVLIPLLGGLGAAISTFVGYASQCALTIYWGRRHVWWPLPYRDLWLAVGATLIAASLSFTLAGFLGSRSWAFPLFTWFLAYGLVISAFLGLSGGFDGRKRIRLQL